MRAILRCSPVLRTSTYTAATSVNVRCRNEHYYYNNNNIVRYFPSRDMTEKTHPSEASSNKPIIVIIGSTGTGKSNLAISIAKYLIHSAVPSPCTGSCATPGVFSGGAEVINADAMQLYAGLPVITNKMSPDEQEGVPHHLLGSIKLDEETWTVSRFVKEADQCIRDIHAQGKIPIVVGGTGYYVHGLLLEGSTLDPRDVAMDAKDGSGDDNGLADQGQNSKEDDHVGVQPSNIDAVLNAPTEEIYAKLQQVDPEIALRWHPNDRRKIQRSLEIWLKTGKKASKVYAAQKLRKGIPAETLAERSDKVINSGQLRYTPLIFWLDADDTVLKDRLNKRVDAMLEKGLISEARLMAECAERLASNGVTIEKDKGIWASIGYKELEPWIRSEKIIDSPLSEKNLDELRHSCLEAVKAGTRRYAKRQNRYIRIRFAKALAEIGASDKLFLLDCSDLARWQDHVEKVAVTLTDDFLSGCQLPPPNSLSDLAHRTFERMPTENSPGDKRVAKRCDTCDKISMTQKEWDKHVNSRSHKKVLEGIKKRAIRRPHLQNNSEMMAT